MADFIVAYKKVCANEGGYVNNPSDRGKETYAGISRKFWPSWRGWEIVEALRKEPGFPKNLDNHPDLQKLREQFYKTNFWDEIKGDEIKSQAIAEELFDTSVNCGINVAIEFAQKSLNILNRNGKLYPDIGVDGKIGPQTLQELNDFTEDKALIRALNAYQGSYYIKLMERDSSQEEFCRGWLNRAS